MNKILLVEADQSKAAALVESLSTQVYWVDYVSDSAEAIGKLGGHRSYSCIIASYEMPCISGIQLISRIRTFDKKIGVVVVADDPAKAEQECDGLDVMAVVDRAAPNGRLLQMVAAAIEMTEMSDERLAEIDTSIHCDTMTLRGISQRP